MVSGSSPILAVVDLPETIRFYTEVLGFTSSWMGGDPPEFGAAIWGNVRIMFTVDPELAVRIEGQQIWLDTENVDALYALHVEHGAMIVSAIEDKPWGFREYTVRDPNGYQLRFTGQPSHSSQGSGVFPADVKIERRVPTVEEFERVVGGAFYRGGVSNGVLDRTWRAVVAVGPGGEVIGTLRIVFDSPGWFSIWDVAVLPSWQGRRIGTTLMQAALELVREESPGAHVYLFTLKHGFYERLGFAKGSVDTLKL
jgi:ribosomal protein S18 acetylase RimI-like enzyme